MAPRSHRPPPLLKSHLFWLQPTIAALPTLPPSAPSPPHETAWYVTAGRDLLSPHAADAVSPAIPHMCLMKAGLSLRPAPKAT